MLRQAGGCRALTLDVAGMHCLLLPVLLPEASKLIVDHRRDDAHKSPEHHILEVIHTFNLFIFTVEIVVVVEHWFGVRCGRHMSCSEVQELEAVLDHHVFHLSQLYRESGLIVGISSTVHSDDNTVR